MAAQMRSLARPPVPTLSVVIPAHNEAGNIGQLVVEVCATLRGLYPFEILCVDDASIDGTLTELRELAEQTPELRILSHPRQSGQSAALCSGVQAAAGKWVATLDGDGQNDPADLPRLWQQHLDAPAGVKLVVGWRTRRRDSLSKRIGSRVANAVRQRLLGDDTPDTGCGIKLIEREAFLNLPHFNHMHRYLPALMKGHGFSAISVPVNHRPRGAGRSHYTNIGRLYVAFADLIGVSWLLRRRAHVAVTETALVSKPVDAIGSERAA